MFRVQRANRLLKLESSKNQPNSQQENQRRGHPLLSYMLRSRTLRVQVPPSQIVYLKFLLEGYDHLALPVVVDGKKAEIKLLIHPTELKIFVSLIKEDFPSAIILGDDENGCSGSI